ncbi:putative EPIDERMAL PATTERNING FACTOR-like protein [Helianthus annuus]|uniref:Epidermal patterning factor-like protein n=1 Tax=Helianthus annuus TaxID=4232 RepID=A0A251T6V5_HELAN|nr:putative EPIDERMAL PATTERNING FACTOR-like protein [Helianthus annuus]KAJ0873280.1 putative EPIDERMAL PATTERNING FACTOR-like protein [Helianthus annuus]
MKHIHSLGLHTWLLAITIFLILNNGESLHHQHSIYGEKFTHGDDQVHKHPKDVELFPTGSNLPDCSHACGPCFPCQRVMVGFKCRMTESCPVIYRCFCKGRYYHVPTS